MPTLPIPDAAAALGVSVDTVRRRIRSGALTAQRDGRGRYLVDVPTPAYADAYAAPGERLGTPTQATAAGDRDREEIAFLRAELERRGVELAEMRRLLGNAQQQLAGLLPAPAESVTTRTEPAENAPLDTQPTQRSRRPRWRVWRR